MIASPKKKTTVHLITAAGISVVGFVAASIGALYIAGMFGISKSFADQIIHAIEIGGWALAVVMGLLSGGTAGVVIGTARWAVTAMGRIAAAA